MMATTYIGSGGALEEILYEDSSRPMQFFTGWNPLVGRNKEKLDTIDWEMQEVGKGAWSISKRAKRIEGKNWIDDPFHRDLFVQELLPGFEALEEKLQVLNDKMCKGIPSSMNFDLEAATTFDMGGALPRGDREQMRRVIAIAEDLPSALDLGEELKTDTIPVFSVEIDPSQREGDVLEVEDDSDVEVIGESLAENEAQGDEFTGL